MALATEVQFVVLYCLFHRSSLMEPHSSSPGVVLVVVMFVVVVVAVWVAVGVAVGVLVVVLLLVLVLVVVLAGSNPSGCFVLMIFPRLPLAHSSRCDCSLMPRSRQFRWVRRLRMATRSRCTLYQGLRDAGCPGRRSGCPSSSFRLQLLQVGFQC